MPPLFATRTAGDRLYRDLPRVCSWADPLYIYELEKASLLDPLTQIANRRFLEMRLASSIAEFRRYAIPFGIIFADIDRFKEINDTHGHLAGDEMLKMICPLALRQCPVN